MHIYEYLFAALIIVIVLSASIVMVSTISTPADNASDRNQLSVTAQKIMTQMLLDSGYPYDWGSISSNPTIFGLAKYGQTSREAYQLDPDKVMRLDSQIPVYLPPQTALKLLNLENEQKAPEYGFTLQFTDAIQVSTPQQTGEAGVDNYWLTVTSDYALPIVGAKVSAILYYIENSRIAHTNTVQGITGYDGSYNATFNTSIETPKVLSVTVDYYGAQTAKFYQISPGPTATLFQNKLVITPNQPYTLGSLLDARQILSVNSNGLGTQDLPIQVGSGLTFNNALEPSAIAVLAISGNNLLLASRNAAGISYQTIDFQNPAVHSTPYSYSLQRTVVIGGSTYTATLYLWRMTI